MHASDRERHMFHLASLLSFEVEKQDGSFVLMRTVDVERPMRQAGLTLEQAEEVLNTWKLRGFHGG
jgi:hypothetical protein